MIKYKIILLILCFFFISIACVKEKYNSLEEKLRSLDNMEKNIYKLHDRDILIQLIKNVPQEVSLTIIWDLKRSKSFLELEKKACELLTIALELLESDELHPIEKQTVIIAIQDVEFDIFKYFLRDVARSFNNQKINYEELFVTFFPYNWNFNVYKNYRDPILREALNILLENDRTSPGFKTLIKKTLSGKMWREKRWDMFLDRLFK